MAFQYAVALSDPTRALSDGQATAALANLRAALDIYARHILGSGSLEVELIVDTSGRTLGSGHSTVAVTKEILPDGRTVIWEGAVHELRTGIDPNDADSDIEITLPPAYLADVLWLDPDPATRATPVAPGRFDAVSFFLHELGHALGFNGRGEPDSGTITGSFLSTYDQMVRADGGRPFFVGPEAVAAYGGPVPLSTVLTNYHHYGHVSADGLDLGLMEGSTYSPSGVRWHLDELDLAILRDVGLSTVPRPIADVGGARFNGHGGDDPMSGGAGADTLIGGAGSDTLDGGEGTDIAVFAGELADFILSRSGGDWLVSDLRSGSPEGDDRVRHVEVLRFADRELDLTVSHAATQTAAANILRGSGGQDLELLVANGVVTSQAAVAELVKAADATTSVATLAYQFFTGKIPSAGGMDYLVSPTGPNPNNLNAPYYQDFNLENRYINFAVNLGREGEGRAGFEAEYGGLSLSAATKKAYGEIFGAEPTDAKVAALLSGGRDLYFEAYGRDGLDGLGTKAAMVGWLLAEAEKADLGLYARANAAFLTDLADGANFAVDLVGAYGKPEYVHEPA